MIRSYARAFQPALAWLVFPILPALLGRTYHETFNFAIFQKTGPDPRDWNWFAWVLLAGPLVGYGFLAGATLGLPDDPDRRGLRGFLSRRSVWVAIGPWAGFIVLTSLYLLYVVAIYLLEWLVPSSKDWPSPLPSGWPNTLWGGILWWVLVVSCVAILAYGWLPMAIAALRRARRRSQLRRTVERGLGAALAFVGSLFGSFWAITEAWRSYFFDARIVPVLLVAVPCLAFLSGCSSSITYGEVRRRELFSAMLSAWLLGLALAWRWWSRPRSRP